MGVTTYTQEFTTTKVTEVVRKYTQEVKTYTPATICTQEFTTPIAPSRMFEALIINIHNLIPKIAPQGIKSIKFIEGEGEVGSIKVINFTEGDHLKFLKHKIDALDTENLVCKYTLIEGDENFDKIESIVYEVQFLPLDDGGCVCKMTSEYQTKGDVELKEEDIKQGKERDMGLYKAVEEYLLANPNVYASIATSSHDVSVMCQHA